MVLIANDRAEIGKCPEIADGGGGIGRITTDLYADPLAGHLVGQRYPWHYVDYVKAGVPNG